ncbi:MAG: alpha-hydroxy acid oxidase [Terriglobales bacterium]
MRNRREFIRSLAGTLCFAAMGDMAGFASQMDQAPGVITDPKEALSVTDFEEAARRKVLPAHWAYMTSGVDDDRTLRANVEAFRHLQLRPRRLVDSTKVDIRTQLFDTTYNSPIFLCPVGGQKSYHEDGELAVARAAKSRGAMLMLATATSVGIEDVNKSLGQPAWFQLYATSSWAATEKLVRRVESAGCRVIVLTVDVAAGRNAESYLRRRPKDFTDCSSCHEAAPRIVPGSDLKEKPMYAGIDMAGVKRHDPALTWSFVNRLRKNTQLKLLIKGIETREDARLCLEHGVDGILVSNHGGRSADTGRSSIEALPEVVNEVGNRLPVLVDGGVRRGTDVFKALALGARAVGIGRPYLWGLGAFGEAGVNRVLEILNDELKLIMGHCGTQNIAAISRAYVTTSAFRF